MTVRVISSSLVLFALCAFTASAQAQNARGVAAKGAGCAVAPAMMRDTAVRLHVEKPDSNDFIKALDVALGYDSVFLTQHPGGIVLSSDSTLRASILFPYPTYRLMVLEALRRRDP